MAETCARIHTMYAGEIVEECGVDEALADPKHPYTSGLIQAIPRTENRRHPLYSIPGRVPPLTAMSAGCRFQSRCAHAKEECQAPQRQLRRRRPWRAVRPPGPAAPARCRERLTGEVEVDEFFIGGEEPGLRGGRAKGKKVFVGCAVERKYPKGFGRVRMAVLPDASTASLSAFLADHVEPGATVVSDGWAAYPGAMTDYYHVPGRATSSDSLTSCPASTGPRPWSSAG